MLFPGMLAAGSHTIRGEEMSRISSAVSGALRLSLCIVAFSLLAAASPQQKTTTQTRKASQLSPEEKEAQKHYRIAQEALKNNDLNTAADELKTALRRWPNNRKKMNRLMKIR